MTTDTLLTPVDEPDYAAVAPRGARFYAVNTQRLNDLLDVRARGVKRAHLREYAAFGDEGYARLCETQAFLDVGDSDGFVTALREFGDSREEMRVTSFLPSYIMLRTLLQPHIRALRGTRVSPETLDLVRGELMTWYAPGDGYTSCYPTNPFAYSPRLLRSADSASASLLHAKHDARNYYTKTEGLHSVRWCHLCVLDQLSQLRQVRRWTAYARKVRALRKELRDNAHRVHDGNLRTWLCVLDILIESCAALTYAQRFLFLLDDGALLLCSPEDAAVFERATADLIALPD